MATLRDLTSNLFNKGKQAVNPILKAIGADVKQFANNRNNIYQRDTQTIKQGLSYLGNKLQQVPQIKVPQIPKLAQTAIRSLPIPGIQMASNPILQKAAGFGSQNLTEDIRGKGRTLTRLSQPDYLQKSVKSLRDLPSQMRQQGALSAFSNPAVEDLLNFTDVAGLAGGIRKGALKAVESIPTSASAGKINFKAFVPEVRDLKTVISKLTRLGNDDINIMERYYDMVRKSPTGTPDKELNELGNYIADYIGIQKGASPKTVANQFQELLKLDDQIKSSGGFVRMPGESIIEGKLRVRNKARSFIDQAQTPEEAVQRIRALETGAKDKVDLAQVRNTLKEYRKTLVSGKGLRQDPLNQPVIEEIDRITNGIPNQNIQPIKEIQPPPIKQPIVQASTTSKILPETSTKTVLQEANLKQQKSNIVRPLEEIVSKSDLKVEDKVGLLDYFRTPDRVLKKIGLEKESALIRQKYDDYIRELPIEINKITEWSKQVPPESNQRIFKFLDGQQVQLNPLESKVAGEIKSYLSEWADKLKLPKDNRISSYITHIFEKDFINKEFDPEIARMIENRVAGSVYDPFVEKRLGAMGYVEDTWRALDAYVKRASRKVNMDVALEQVKAKAKGLEQSQHDYVKQYIDRINMRPTKLDNLVDNSIKQLVGYKFGQRPTAYITKAGRQAVYRGALGLNFGSALRNLSQGANTYAKLGERYTLKGYTDLIRKGTKELEDVGVLRDDFLQDRVISAGKQVLQKVDKGLFALFEYAEKINRGSAYYGAKAKALSMGMSEQQAIEFGKKMVRDTQFTFGSVDTPVAMQSDIVKLLSQFQSYTLKQGEFLGEMIAKKDLAGLLRYSLAGMAFVYGAGQLIGMEPKDLIPSVRFGLPPTLQFPLEVGKAVVGAKDKYGNIPDTKEKLQNIGGSLVPFIPGGVQIKKTLGGIKDVSKGYSESSSGRVRYPVSQNTGNMVRGAMFGGYNLPEAKEYKKQDRSVLSDKQSQVVKSATNKKEAYGKIINKREQDKVIDQAKEQLKISGAKTSTAGDKVFILQDNGDIKTVDKNIILPSKPALTTSSEVNKKLMSKYTSKLTTASNDIMALYEAGVITEQEAEKKLNEVKALKTKTLKPKKPKKPKKITIKVPKFKRIKIAKFKPVKVKIKKLKLKKYKAKKI